MQPVSQTVSRRPYSAFHTLVQEIASTRPVARLFSHILPPLDRAVVRVTGRRTTLTALLAGTPVVMVTTVGAKSGRLRNTPLLCIRDERAPEAFALIASNWGQHHHPAWYHNLKAHPRVTCSFGDNRGGPAFRNGEYLAHEAEGDEYTRYWDCATASYAGYALYKERTGGRPIPIVVMVPSSN